MCHTAAWGVELCSNLPAQVFAARIGSSARSAAKATVLSRFILMARHHFVPQFLLHKWAHKGQLVSYTRIKATGAVKAGSTSVVKACQVKDLNAFFGISKEKREAPERDFWTPHIDSPAANAHQTILKYGVQALSSEQQEAWAAFLISFGVRTPETLRILGPAEYRKAMAKSQTNPTEAPEVEAVVNDLIAAEMRKLERNVPIHIAMKLASDPAKTSAAVSYTHLTLPTKRIV